MKKHYKCFNNGCDIFTEKPGYIDECPSCQMNGGLVTIEEWDKNIKIISQMPKGTA